MNRVKIVLLAVTLCVMAGCTITGPGIRISAPLPGVDIDLHAGHASHDGREEHDDD